MNKTLATLRLWILRLEMLRMENWLTLLPDVLVIFIVVVLFFDIKKDKISGNNNSFDENESLGLSAYL